MNIYWSHHARDRLRERASKANATALIERALAARSWEIWFEVDERNERGLRCNLVVEAGGVRAVARHGENGEDLVVVSVLTEHQYQFNIANLWAKTSAEAIALVRERYYASQRRYAKPMKPLTHSPFRTR